MCGEVTEPQQEAARAMLNRAKVAKAQDPIRSLPALPILSLAKRRGAS